MRIKEKKLRSIYYMIYTSIAILIAYMRIKKISSGDSISPPNISIDQFEIGFAIVISILTLLSISKRIGIYLKTKNRTTNIQIDTKTSKKYAFYMMLVYDIFFIVIGIGIGSLPGLIIILNVVVWITFELRWLSTYDGLNETHLYYNESVYLVDNIEKCVVEEDAITFTLTYKLFFLNVIKIIELEINKDEISKLPSLIKNTSVEVKSII